MSSALPMGPCKATSLESRFAEVRRLDEVEVVPCLSLAGAARTDKEEDVARVAKIRDELGGSLIVDVRICG